MKSLKYLLFITIGLLITSVLFYGIQLPAKNFIGCYADGNNTNKICINADSTFEQFIYKNGAWELFHSSKWTSLMMKDITGEFAFISVESSKNNDNKIFLNVTLQPYKDLLGPVKIAVGLNSGNYEEYEIYKMANKNDLDR